jgi:hypothetical protein
MFLSLQLRKTNEDFRIVLFRSDIKLDWFRFNSFSVFGENAE